MLRKSLLCLAVLLSADITTTAASPLLGASITADAQAADFTGRIKRIKIRKKRVGSGFKVKVVTASGSTADVSHTTVTLTDPQTQTVIDTLDLEDPNRARLKYRFDASEVENTGALEVSVSFRVAGEDSAQEVSLERLEDNRWEGTNDSGWKIRARLQDNSGALRVTVLNEDRTWDGGGISDVAATVSDYITYEYGLLYEIVENDLLEEEVVENTFGGETVDLSEHERLTATVVMYDADGTVLERLSQTVSTAADEAAPGLSRVTLRESRRGDARLVTWTHSDGRAAALEVELIDNETGEAVLMTVDDTPIETARAYVSDSIDFEDDPTGQVYRCLVDMLDEAGNPIGEQREVALTMPGYDEEAGTSGQTWGALTDADGQRIGVIGLYASADGTSAAVAYNGEDDVRGIESINLIFEEPFEGPPPLETEINLSLRREEAKWVQRGSGSVPANYTVTTALVTADGEVLDSASATGSGTGAVFRLLDDENVEDVVNQVVETSLEVLTDVDATLEF